MRFVLFFAKRVFVKITFVGSALLYIYIFYMPQNLGRRSVHNRRPNERLPKKVIACQTSKTNRRTNAGWFEMPHEQMAWQCAQMARRTLVSCHFLYRLTQNQCWRRGNLNLLKFQLMCKCKL